MTEMRRSASGSAVELKPHLDKIDPPAGAPDGDERVTLTGTGLANVQRVIFGTEEATDVKVVNATKVTCLTPPNAHGPIKVYAVDQLNTQSNKITFTYR
jgi:hypothetical protein